MKRWLFTDYDGTLRNGSDGEVDEQDVDFVKKFCQQNNNVVLASGRPFEHMLREANRLGLKPTLYITNAGSIIRNSRGELLYSRCLSHEDTKTVAKYLEAMNLETLIYATPEEEVYLFSDNPSKYDNGQLKRRVTNEPFSSLDDKDVVCFKAISTREKLDNLISFIQQNLPQLSIINNKDRDLVEIHPVKSSKGHAIRLSQAIFNLSQEQIITVGDDDNDITMLKWYQNSFVIKQPYNEEIQKYGKTKINYLYEIANYLKK